MHATFAQTLGPQPTADLIAVRRARKNRAKTELQHVKAVLKPRRGQRSCPLTPNARKLQTDCNLRKLQRNGNTQIPQTSSGCRTAWKNKSSCRTGRKTIQDQKTFLTANPYALLSQEPTAMFSKRKADGNGIARFNPKRFSEHTKETRSAGDALEFVLLFHSREDPSKSANTPLTTTEWKQAAGVFSVKMRGTPGAVPRGLENLRHEPALVLRFEDTLLAPALDCAQAFAYSFTGQYPLEISPPGFGNRKTFLFNVQPYDKHLYHKSHWKSVKAIGHGDVIFKTIPQPGGPLVWSPAAVGDHIKQALGGSYLNHFAVRDSVGDVTKQLTFTIYSRVDPAALFDDDTEQPTVTASAASEADTTGSNLPYLHHLIAAANPALVPLTELVAHGHLQEQAPEPEFQMMHGVMATFCMEGKHMREDLSISGCERNGCNLRHRKELCNKRAAIQERVQKAVTNFEQEEERRANRRAQRGEDTKSTITHTFSLIGRKLERMFSTARKFLCKTMKQVHKNSKLIITSKKCLPGAQQQTGARNGAPVQVKALHLDSDILQVADIVRYSTYSCGNPQQIPNLTPPYGLQHKEGRNAWISTMGIEKINEALDHTSGFLHPIAESLLISSINDLRYDTLGNVIPGGFLKSALKTNQPNYRTLIPIAQPNHYVALIIDHSRCQLTYFDSFGNPINKSLKDALNRIFPHHALADANLHLQTDTHNCAIWVLWLCKAWKQYQNVTPPNDGNNDLNFHTYLRNKMIEHNITNLKLPHSHKAPTQNAHFIQQLRHDLHQLITPTSNTTHETQSTSNASRLPLTSKMNPAPKPFTHTHRRTTPNPKSNKQLAQNNQKHNELPQDQGADENHITATQPDPSNPTNPLDMHKHLWVTPAKLKELLTSATPEKRILQPIPLPLFIKQLNNLSRSNSGKGLHIKMRTRSLMLPLYQAHHWTCVMIDHTKRRTYFFDPGGSPADPNLIKALQNYFFLYHNVDMRIKTQTDKHSCGYWICWMSSLWEHYCTRSTSQEETEPFDELVLKKMTQLGVYDLHKHEEELETQANLSFIQEQTHMTQLHTDPEHKTHSHERTKTSSLSKADNTSVNDMTHRQITKHLKELITKTPTKTCTPATKSRTLLHTIQRRRKSRNKETESSQSEELLLTNHQYARLVKQKDMNRITIVGTNMQGKSTADMSIPGDTPKLDALCKQISDGIIDVLCICETKLCLKDIETIRTKIHSHNLQYRMSWANNRASRGALIIWNANSLPMQISRTYIDGTDKRVVSIVMKGGKGTTLTVTCAYMEDASLPRDEHTKFYNFLARGVPPPTT